MMWSRPTRSQLARSNEKRRESLKAGMERRAKTYQSPSEERTARLQGMGQPALLLAR